MKSDRATKRERKSRSRWKLLDADDLVYVLREVQEMDSKLREETKQDLKRRINAELTEANKLQSLDEIPSHEYRDQLKEIQKAAREIEAAWRSCPLADRQFAYAIDFLANHPSSKAPATVEALREEFPDHDSGTLFFVSRYGVVVPSSEAKAQVTLARHLLAKVRLWACCAEFLEDRRRKKGGLGVRQPGNQPDDPRHVLMVQLGTVFEDIFGLSPKATLGGPWYSFLAAVLTCSEGEHLSSDDVHPKWLRTRKWRKQNAEAALALIQPQKKRPGNRWQKRPAA